MNVDSKVISVCLETREMVAQVRPAVQVQLVSVVKAEDPELQVQRETLATKVTSVEDARIADQDLKATRANEDSMVFPDLWVNNLDSMY